MDYRSYYINESISLERNITDNMHKLYMALFMSCQMGILELGMMYLLHGLSQIEMYAMIFLIISTIIIGNKLKTLDFLDEKQFLLSMIEHHENAIVMANKTINKVKDPELITLLNNIRTTQNQEIEQMNNMLKRMKLT